MKIYKEILIKFVPVFIFTLSFLIYNSFAITTINNCTSLSSPGTFVLGSDILNSGSTSCFNISSSGVVLDLAGHTVNGNGSLNSKAINFSDQSSSLTGVIVENGVLSNWSYGAYFNDISSSGAGNDNILISNMTLNHNAFDFYLFGGYPYNLENFTLTNSNLYDNSFFSSLNLLNFYRNTVSTANYITNISVANFNLNELVNGSLIGNKWGDFICSDPTNNHIIDYNNIKYVVCDSNDYNLNTIVDKNPIINISIISGLSKTKTKTSSIAKIFPEGGDSSQFLTLSMLLVYFIF